MARIRCLLKSKRLTLPAASTGYYKPSSKLHSLLEVDLPPAYLLPLVGILAEVGQGKGPPGENQTPPGKFMVRARTGSIRAPAVRAER